MAHKIPSLQKLNTDQSILTIAYEGSPTSVESKIEIPSQKPLQNIQFCIYPKVQNLQV